MHHTIAPLNETHCTFKAHVDTSESTEILSQTISMNY